MLYGFIQLADLIFDGAFASWLGRNMGLYDEQKGFIFTWRELKPVLLASFIISVFVITVVNGIYYYWRRLGREKQEFAIISALFSDYSAGEELREVPEKYYQIANQLRQTRSHSEKNEQLVQLESQRTKELLTYLAHDMKTPLASVLGYLNLLDEVPDMPLQQRIKYTQIALEKGEQLDYLMNEFFEITRFNLQELELSKQKINLLFMFQQIKDELYPLLSKAGKDISLAVPEDLSLLGDGDQLARVFKNVLKNALTYSYPETAIHVIAQISFDDVGSNSIGSNEVGSNKVEISIINQGDQIPSRKLDMIFEKFYRLDTARSTATGGAGLGLAIAKEIVAAHEGTIEAISNLEETVFKITLPLS